MKFRSAIVLIILCLPVVPAALMGEGIPEFEIQKSFYETVLVNRFQYILTKSDNKTLEQVRSIPDAEWLSTTQKRLGLGYVEADIWFRIRVRNSSGGMARVFIQERNTLLDHLSIYIFNQAGELRELQMGDMRPFSGRPISHRSFIVPLDLEPGASNLIYGKISNKGSMLSDSFLLSQSALYDHLVYEDIFNWLFYGFILIMIIYNAFLYLSIRDEAYIFYVLYIACWGLTMFSLDGLTFQFILPELPELSRFVLIYTAFLGYIFALLFLRSFLNVRKYSIHLERAIFVQVIFYGACLLLPFFIDYQYVWTITIVPFVLSVSFILLLSGYLMKKKNRQAVFVLVSFACVCIGIVMMQLQYAGIIPSNGFTARSVYFGSIAELTLLSLALADRIKGLQIAKTQTEKQYMHVIHRTDDIFFTLDSNLDFVEANPSVEERFGYNEEEIQGQNFLSLVYETGGESRGYARTVVSDYCREVLSTKGQVAFKAYFKGRYSLEPIHFFVKLEYIDWAEKAKIYGNLSKAEAELLFENLNTEEQSFSIGNFFNQIEILGDQVTMGLKKYLAPQRVLIVKTALREILFNSLEHGNLELTYEDKRAALEEGRYFEIIKERQNSPEFSNRKITLEHSLNSERAAYRISDEGSGFDFKNTLEMVAQRVRDSRYPNGRGLLMVMSEFDLVEFVEPGNQVLLVKYLGERKRSADEIFSEGIFKKSSGAMPFKAQD